MLLLRRPRGVERGSGLGVVERMCLIELRGFFAFSCLLGFAISWVPAVLRILCFSVMFYPVPVYHSYYFARSRA